MAVAARSAAELELKGMRSKFDASERHAAELEAKFAASHSELAKSRNGATSRLEPQLAAAAAPQPDRGEPTVARRAEPTVARAEPAVGEQKPAGAATVTEMNVTGIVGSIGDQWAQRRHGYQSLHQRARQARSQLPPPLVSEARAPPTSPTRTLNGAGGLRPSTPTQPPPPWGWRVDGRIDGPRAHEAERPSSAATQTWQAGELSSELMMIRAQSAPDAQMWSKPAERFDGPTSSVSFADRFPRHGRVPDQWKDVARIGRHVSAIGDVTAGCSDDTASWSAIGGRLRRSGSSGRSRCFA